MQQVFIRDFLTFFIVQLLLTIAQDKGYWIILFRRVVKHLTKMVSPVVI